MATDSEIKEAIRKIVSNIASRNDELIFLATLGTKLSRELGGPFKEQRPGLKLSDFIRENCHRELEVVQDEKTPLLVYVRVIDSTFLFDEDKYDRNFELLTKDRTFFRSFWSTFAKPLDLSKRRYLRKSSPYTYIDLSHTATIACGYHEIDARFVVPASVQAGSERSVMVRHMIRSWLKFNRLMPDNFLQRPVLSGDTSGEIWSERSKKLLRFLDELEDEDLKRISIPADIVLRILDRK